MGKYGEVLFAFALLLLTGSLECLINTTMNSGQLRVRNTHMPLSLDFPTYFLFYCMNRKNSIRSSLSLVHKMSVGRPVNWVDSAS